ncbi:MAG: histidine kinase [Pseudomonadota bacterium]
MPTLYWDPLAVSILVTIIFLWSLLGYFITQLFAQAKEGRLDRETVIITILILAASLGLPVQFFADYLHPDVGNYALPWAGPLGAAIMCAHLAFSFYFKRNSQSGHLIELLLAGLFVAVIALEVAIAVQRHRLLGEGLVEYREHFVGVSFTLGYFVTYIVFVWRLTALLARDEGLNATSALRLALRAIVWPWTRLSYDAASVRAFLYASCLPLLAGVIHLLVSAGIVDWPLAVILIGWIALLTFAALTLAYLNYVPDRSSFRIKLIGITLATVLCLLSGVSWLTGSVYVESYRSPHYMSDQSAILFEPTDNGGYIAGSSAYAPNGELGLPIDDITQPVALPFGFSFYGETYEQLFVRASGQVGFESLPEWRHVQFRFGPQPAIFVLALELEESRLAEPGRSGLFVNVTSEQATFTWNRLVSAYHPEEEYSFQLKLFPSGAIEMLFIDLPETIRSDIFVPEASPTMTGIVPAFEDRHVSPARFASALPHLGAPGEGIMEVYERDFQIYLNRIYQPIAVFALSASLLILLVFPQFFRVNLDEPLKDLLHGVRSIMNGKLTTSIDVRHRDEIGYLASSFNEMAKAQHELVQGLEDKVAERTSEATEYAARNARLEERNHLARELHDAVSQTLFSANLIADTLPDLQKGGVTPVQDAVSEIRRLNKDALGEMRNLLLELQPEKLTAHPFGQLLRSIVKSVERNFTVQINCTVESDTALPRAVQLAFYRIAQESLTNAAKHADARSISVYFDGLDSQALLVIKDDGCGFDRANVPLGHMGLHFMKERMADIGGTLTLDTSPGKGTSIEAVWFDGDN